MAAITTTDPRRVHAYEVMDELSRLGIRDFEDQAHLLREHQSLVDKHYRLGIEPEETARMITRRSLPSYSQNYAVERARANPMPSLSSPAMTIGMGVAGGILVAELITFLARKITTPSS